jgi:hypothetical protein
MRRVGLCRELRRPQPVPLQRLWWQLLRVLQPRLREQLLRLPELLLINAEAGWDMAVDRI